MAEDTLNSELFWNNTFTLKVEDQLFCVPLQEFVNSSEVFADMFLLPSGPATCSEGHDRDHPIVLEGYKKDEFACLLRVMYPTAGSLIFDNKLELYLEKEEWVSVLKLSTIWDMKNIRQYAIHKLSNDVILSPMEKMRLARVHRVPRWLDEAVTSLASCNPKPTLEDLATFGWETAARILWIRDNSSSNLSLIPTDSVAFRRGTIKCASCEASLNSLPPHSSCEHSISDADAELIFPGPGSPTASGSGNADRLVSLGSIQCRKCGRNPFSTYVRCNSSSCSEPFTQYSVVRITPRLKETVEEMFGEEIKDYSELPTTIE